MPIHFECSYAIFERIIAALADAGLCASVRIQSTPAEAEQSKLPEGIVPLKEHLSE